MRAFGHRLALTAITIAWIGLASASSGCAPVNGSMLNASGQRMYRQGNYTQARREFERALAASPNNADYTYNVAAAMKQQGDIQGAEQMYRKAVFLDPSHQPAYHGLASMLNEQGRAPEAQSLVTAWARTQPYVPEAQVELATIQREQGDFAGAEQSLRHALKTNPGHSIANAHLGQLYAEVGQPQQAAQLYGRSLALNPNQPQVKARLAQITPQHRNVNNGGQRQPLRALAWRGPSQPRFASAPQQQYAAMPVHYGGPMSGQQMPPHMLTMMPQQVMQPQHQMMIPPQQMVQHQTVSPQMAMHQPAILPPTTIYDSQVEPAGAWQASPPSGSPLMPPQPTQTFQVPPAPSHSEANMMPMPEGAPLLLPPPGATAQQMSQPATVIPAANHGQMPVMNASVMTINPF